MGVLWYYIITRDDPYALTVEIPVLMAFLFINISIFVFYDRFSLLIRDATETKMLEQQLYMQSRYYEDLEASQKQIRSIRHDMKNYLITAFRLAQQQSSNDELIGFLKKTSGEIEEVNQVVSTGNAYLDSVINIKIAEMQSENMQG